MFIPVKAFVNQINKFWILSTNYCADKKWINSEENTQITPDILSADYFIRGNRLHSKNRLAPVRIIFYNLHNIISVMHCCMCKCIFFLKTGRCYGIGITYHTLMLIR